MCYNWIASPQPLPLYIISVSSAFLDSMYRWNHSAFVFLSLNYFICILLQGLCMLTQMAKCPSFLRLKSIPLCIYTTFLSPFIYWYLHCFYVLAIKNYVVMNMGMQIYFYKFFHPCFVVFTQTRREKLVHWNPWKDVEFC